MGGVGDRGAHQAEGAAGGENLCLRQQLIVLQRRAAPAVAWWRSALLDPRKTMLFRLAVRAAHCTAFKLSMRQGLSASLPLAPSATVWQRSAGNACRAQKLDPGSFL